VTRGRASDAARAISVTRNVLPVVKNNVGSCHAEHTDATISFERKHALSQAHFETLLLLCTCTHIALSALCAACVFPRSYHSRNLMLRTRCSCPINRYTKQSLACAMSPKQTLITIFRPSISTCLGQIALTQTRSSKMLLSSWNDMRNLATRRPVYNVCGSIGNG
jgi:hypothetical protein